MGKMFDKFADMLSRGEYDSPQELCNDKGLNWDDLYEDDAIDDDD